MEDENQLPTMDDDGFESLDGNGSSDSNKEEQDISLTPAEFETALKNNSVRGDSYENSLVILKCCPKFSRQNNVPNQSICKNAGNDGDDHTNLAENQCSVEHCLKVPTAVGKNLNNESDSLTDVQKVEANEAPDLVIGKHLFNLTFENHLRLVLFRIHVRYKKKSLR